MKTKNCWAPPGWPWELELLALVFVIIAIALPAYLSITGDANAPEEELSLKQTILIEELQNETNWDQLQGFFWALGIIGLYAVHIALSNLSVQYLTTSFTHLFTPVVFSMITYYRLYTLTSAENIKTPLVSGSPVEIASWIAGVLIITLLVARMRMKRHLKQFKMMTWDLTCGTRLDTSYFSLMAHFHPIFYPPHRYRVCNEGILIEGWFYSMALSFEVMQGVDSVRMTGFTSNGLYLATSDKALIRIRVVDHPEPVYISPKERKEFVQLCERYIIEKKGTYDTKG